MRLLITGGSSYLGRHLVPLAVQQGHSVTHSYFQNQLDLPGQAVQLDLQNERAVATLLAEVEPEAVIHLAGSNRAADLAGLIVEGTANLCNALKSGTRLINLSTDVIFDGLNAPYDEKATPSPLHEYGQAKVKAEAIANRHNDQVTIRTSLIYGFATMDRGTEGLRHRLTQGEQLALFKNQIRNPIWADSLCLAVLELLDHTYQGILNVAGSESIDRASYCLALLNFWKIETEGRYIAVPATGGRFPPDTRLDISRAQKLLKTPLPGFHDILLRHKLPTDKMTK